MNFYICIIVMCNITWPARRTNDLFRKTKNSHCVVCTHRFDSIFLYELHYYIKEFFSPITKSIASLIKIHSMNSKYFFRNLLQIFCQARLALYWNLTEKCIHIFTNTFVIEYVFRSTYFSISSVGMLLCIHF